jgi:hypothetical protein
VAKTELNTHAPTDLKMLPTVALVWSESDTFCPKNAPSAEAKKKLHRAERSSAIRFLLHFVCASYGILGIIGANIIDSGPSEFLLQPTYSYCIRYSTYAILPDSGKIAYPGSSRICDFQ